MAGAFTFVLVFTAYLATNHPWVASDDSGQFQTMAATGGIAHAGYPTFVLALELFGRLAWSTFAFRANLLGCVSGALAAALAAALGARMSGRAWAGIAAGVALALSYQLWQSSTVAEVYAFTLALGVVLFLLARRLARTPDAPTAFAAGTLGGLGLGSHLTMLSLGPVVVVALVAAWRAGRLRGLVIAALCAGFLAGLAPLGYFIAQDRPDRPMNYLALKTIPGPERDAQPTLSLSARAGRVVYLLSGRQYLGSKGEIHGLRNTLQRFRSVVFDLVLNEYFILGLPLAAYGAYLLVRRRELEALLLATWLASCVFLIWYAAISFDIAATYFIYGLWILAIAASVGLAALAERRQWLGGAVALLLVLAPLARLAMPSPFRGPELLASTWARLPGEWNPLVPDRSWDDYGRGVMGALPPGAILLSNWTEGMPMEYMRHAERLRDDVDIVLTENAGELAAYAPRVLAGGRPCFSTLNQTAETAIPGLRSTEAGRWRRGRLWSIGPAALEGQDSTFGR